MTPEYLAQILRSKNGRQEFFDRNAAREACLFLAKKYLSEGEEDDEYVRELAWLAYHLKLVELGSEFVSVAPKLPFSQKKLILALLIDLKVEIQNPVAWWQMVCADTSLSGYFMSAMLQIHDWERAAVAMDNLPYPESEDILFVVITHTQENLSVEDRILFEDAINKYSRFGKPILQEVIDACS